ncbi:hypothetical protein BLGI_3167 [Brevibacillus laterosporus GI-9]|nr:hypothetical protein BLGI_3167 [Brevibacillus laterosporus GI-9]
MLISIKHNDLFLQPIRYKKPEKSFTSILLYVQKEKSQHCQAFTPAVQMLAFISYSS